MRWSQVLFGISLAGALGYAYSYERDADRKAFQKLEARIHVAEARAAEAASAPEPSLLSALLEANSRNPAASTAPPTKAATAVDDAGPTSEPITQEDVNGALAEQFEQAMAGGTWARVARSQALETLSKTKIESASIRDVQCRDAICKLQIVASDRSDAIGVMSELRVLSWTGPIAAFVQGDGPNSSVTVYLGEQGSVFHQPERNHG
jgi:hypothetical protein